MFVSSRSEQRLYAAYARNSIILGAECPKRSRHNATGRSSSLCGDFTLGAALQKQDRLSEAVDAYQQSLQLDPGNDSLRGYVGQLSATLPQ